MPGKFRIKGSDARGIPATSILIRPGFRDRRYREAIEWLYRRAQSTDAENWISERSPLRLSPSFLSRTVYQPISRRTRTSHLRSEWASSRDCLPLSLGTPMTALCAGRREIKLDHPLCSTIFHCFSLRASQNVGLSKWIDVAGAF